MLTIEGIAERMVKRYGRDRAIEFAYGYAVGAYFQQTEAGRKHWLDVEAAIRAMPNENPNRVTRS